MKSKGICAVCQECDWRSDNGVVDDQAFFFGSVFG